MKMTNGEIYNRTNILFKEFNNYDKYLPAKINFYFTKNKNLLIKKVEEIEKVKNDICSQYKDNDVAMEKELDDLSLIEQDIDFFMIPISWFGNEIFFTIPQMDALLFMIDDKEEEKENSNE